jgi:hypothetical protein
MGCQCAKPPANGNMNLETAPPKSLEPICEETPVQAKVEQVEKPEKTPEKVEDTVRIIL